MKITKIYKKGSYADLSKDKVKIEMTLNEWIDFIDKLKLEYREEIYKIDKNAKTRWVK